MRWIGGYERSWRDGDVTAVESLFTPGARYRRSPYEPPLVGHEEIRSFWTADEGAVFTMRAEPIAVEGRDAVVRVEVWYSEPVRQEYRDLWVLDFADDGRVDEFEEWAYWPGSAYSAEAAD
jgi:hypothetical protein